MKVLRAPQGPLLSVIAEGVSSGLYQSPERGRGWGTGQRAQHEVGKPGGEVHTCRCAALPAPFPGLPGCGFLWLEAPCMCHHELPYILLGQV